MSEIEILLNELRNLKQEKKNIPNTKETWKYISQKDWTAADFDSEEDAKSWLENNSYLSL